jgi:hypothetical protein
MLGLLAVNYQPPACWKTKDKSTKTKKNSGRRGESRQRRARKKTNEKLKKS